MSGKQTFLERTPQVPEQVLDKLEQLLRTKIDLKTGYAEPHALSRCMFHTLKTIDMSDDQVMTRDSFQVIMNKLNCGEDRLACSALFHRYDRRGTGRVGLRDFADGLFGLLPISGSDAECRDILSSIRANLQSRGESGFWGLTNELRSQKRASLGNRLTPANLKNGLAKCGIDITAYELNTLVFYFDKLGEGTVDAAEFMVGLRPKISDARLALVKLAFLRLDKNPDGVVTLASLRAMYDPTRNPSVLRGESTASQVEHDFSLAWSFSPEIISESDFIDYYCDLSACIDNDSYFELLVRNSWKVGGGKNPVKGGTIRVVVTHMDGTSTVETLDSDLGVDVSSSSSLISTLRKQGVSDILKAELALYR